MGQMTGLLIYGGSLGDFYALAMQTKPKRKFFGFAIVASCPKFCLL